METREIYWISCLGTMDAAYSNEICNTIIFIHCGNSIENPNNHGIWICTNIRA